jgi:hypothetical protein
MSGWTALCLFLLALHVNEPFIGLVALLVYACNDSPRQRAEKLQARIRKLERQQGDRS